MTAICYIAAPSPMSVPRFPAVLAYSFQSAISFIDSSAIIVFALHEQGATARRTATNVRMVHPKHAAWHPLVYLPV